MATLTTAEAADLVGVSVRTVEQWVRRGHLTPCNRPDPTMPSAPKRAAVARFRGPDVIECAHARLSRASHERLDRLAEDMGLVAL